MRISCFLCLVALTKNTDLWAMNGNEIRASIDAFIRALPWADQQPTQLYAPMLYLLNHEAKRVRPVMTVLAYQYITGAADDKITGTASAIELVHNFTLMHDDIMDHAPVRRGLPTVHEKWDTNTAILSGDALFALAYPMLIKNFPDKAAPLVDFFTRVVVEVCEGQMEDMNLALRSKVSIPEYLEMIRKKTAALLGGSLGIGALAAGADKDIVQKLYKAGEYMGIGFQIQDDLLDVYAEQGKFGKQVGGDIIENKKTYLWLRALEKSNLYQKEALLNWIPFSGDPAVKIESVKQMYDELDIYPETLNLAKSYYARAAGELDRLPDLPMKHALTAYLETVFMREK